MTLAKWKFFVSLLAAAVVGAGLGFGGYKAFEKENPEQAASPRPVVSASPSPSLRPSILPSPGQSAQSAQTSEADQDQITRIGKAYYLAVKGTSNPAYFKIATIQGSFAKVNASQEANGTRGVVIILKKSGTIWVPLYVGNGGPSETDVENFQIPRTIIDAQ